MSEVDIKCKRCGYDLRRTESVCPECGGVFDRDDPSTFTSYAREDYRRFNRGRCLMFLSVMFMVLGMVAVMLMDHLLGLSVASADSVSGLVLGIAFVVWVAGAVKLDKKWYVRLMFALFFIPAAFASVMTTTILMGRALGWWPD